MLPESKHIINLDIYSLDVFGIEFKKNARTSLC